jgi:hypothetical protein
MITSRAGSRKLTDISAAAECATRMMTQGLVCWLATINFGAKIDRSGGQHAHIRKIVNAVDGIDVFGFVMDVPGRYEWALFQQAHIPKWARR